MNAATFTKPAKGLILASGLIVGSSLAANAQDATVALGSLATVPLSSMYASAPTGIATLGGHSFDLTSGNQIQLTNGQSASFTGSWTNANGVYLLLNSANTYLWYDQSIVGDVTITFSDGTTQVTNLIVGGNLREWRTGAGFTDNTLTDPAATQVWNGTAVDGTAATIDMLSIQISPAKTITSIAVDDTNGFGALRIQLSGLTVDPTVTPTATFNRPGNSGDSQAINHSQAAQHSNSANFTGVSPSQGKSASSANAGMNTPATTHEHPAH